MKAYYLLRLAVYGQMGPDTDLDPTVHPPTVRNLHLVLDSPPRDDLHTTFPCFLVSGRLGRQIAEAALTGVELGHLQVEMNEQYREVHPDESIPEVLWLKVNGPARDADFGLDSEGLLVVSDVAMESLRRFRLEECQVYDAGTPPTQEQISEDVWEEARRTADALRRAKKDAR